jgi:hypothetical protein
MSIHLHSLEKVSAEAKVGATSQLYAKRLFLPEWRREVIEGLQKKELEERKRLVRAGQQTRKSWLNTRAELLLGGSSVKTFRALIDGASTTTRTGTPSCSEKLWRNTPKPSGSRVLVCQHRADLFGKSQRQTNAKYASIAVFSTNMPC